jgi:uncharacterized protein
VALDTATEFVSFTDGAPDTGAAEFAIVGAPAHGQLDVADATPLSSATLTYPPDPGYVGPDTFIYGLRDASSPYPVPTGPSIGFGSRYAIWIFSCGSATCEPIREPRECVRFGVTVRSAVSSPERITNLDTVRGVATLGILVMNAVSFALPEAAYFNLDAAGTKTWLDWAIGIAGEIFVDQKTMALFSLLFGAGIVVFADRAEAKGLRPAALSMWRNVLLLCIGALHSILWEGDILVVYALCAPILLMLRRRSPRLLLGAGTALVLSSALIAVIAQTEIPADGTGLGSYWFVDGGPIGDAPGVFLISDFFLRALGMMLIGVGLFRLHVVQGTRDPVVYRTMMRWGLGLGVPIATAGVIVQIANDWDPSIAVIGEAPNTLATIPIALGYLGAISLWNQRRPTGAHRGLRAVGRMALTNYLLDTMLGVLVFRGIFDLGDATRTTIAMFVVVVWTAQVWWSTWWLERFRFGPLEWGWRCLTYRKIQPFRIR